MVLGDWITYSLKGIIRLWITPGLLVPAHPLPDPIFRSFEFSVSFCWFKISWSHSSVVPSRVVFDDRTHQVFLSFFPEYA